MAVVWLWFKQTRVARRIYALGSDREGARIRRRPPAADSGADLCHLRACAPLWRALFYAMLTASGDPTAGDGLILPAVAAVVIWRHQPVRGPRRFYRDDRRSTDP